MNRIAQLAAVLTFALVSSASIAQEHGTWVATSKTATGITGDITFGNEKLTLNFVTFPLAEIHPLKFDEMNAVFSAGGPDGLNPRTTGNLFRISIPGEKKFLHKNTLCGSEEVTWVASAVSGRTLQLALFSGARPPVLTAEAIGQSTDLCGTYTYSR